MDWGSFTIGFIAGGASATVLVVVFLIMFYYALPANMDIWR